MKAKGLSLLLLLLLFSCHINVNEVEEGKRKYINDGFTSSNSPYYLQIKNYVRNFQNLHPKVLYFEKGWHGHKFWMAYTPYPYQKIKYENPCIAVSNDGIWWLEPKGLTNPLEKAPAEGYNSDPHLVYDEKNDILECWWRAYNIDTGADCIYRKRTVDGVKWSEKEIVMPFGKSGKNRLSPAVWIQDGEYKMVYCDGQVLWYVSSPRMDEGFSWGEPQKLPVDWGDLRAWHQDLIIDEDGMWELVVNCYSRFETYNMLDLYYLRLNPDFTEEATPTLIVHRSENKRDFDSRSIYRSSVVKVEGEYFLYYSCTNMERRCFIVLLRGPSLLDLRTLTAEEMNIQ